MRIAIVSDIHGNLEALESVLRDAQKCGVEHFICAGDAIDPLPQSQRVLDRLEELRAPLIRGNHEDYVLRALQNPFDPIASAPNWEPVRLVARSLNPDTIARLNRLPMTLTVAHEHAGPLLICHSSPRSNLHGWRILVDDDMAKELQQRSEPTIVCGHWHLQDTRRWRDKTLILNGSVGIPLNGKIAAEYVIIEARNDTWQSEHRQVPYDNQITLRDYRDSGWAKVGGPMAWLLFDEVRTAQRRLVSFYEWLGNHPQPINTLDSLTKAVKAYLNEINSWESITAFLGQL